MFVHRTLIVDETFKTNTLIATRIYNKQYSKSLHLVTTPSFPPSLPPSCPPSLPPFLPPSLRLIDETLNKDSIAGILQGFLGLLMIKVKSHLSVGTPTDFCQDVTRLIDEHGISTVVFPWESGSTQPSTQLNRVKKLMETTRSQVRRRLYSSIQVWKRVVLVTVVFSPLFCFQYCRKLMPTPERSRCYSRSGACSGKKKTASVTR